MADAGTVWLYPKVVASTLSQFRMVVHSKWEMNYNTEAPHKSKDIKNLSYDVITVQVLECEFVP